MPVADESIRQVVLAPKSEHSRKPDEVQERIELLYPMPPDSRCSPAGVVLAGNRWDSRFRLQNRPLRSSLCP